MTLRSLVLPLVLVLSAFAAETPLEDQLWNAVRSQDASEVFRLLGAGVDPDAQNRYGATPLSSACANGNEAIVDLLLDAGAKVNVVDRFYGHTPIRWAAESGNRGLVERLLERGARPSWTLFNQFLQEGDESLAGRSISRLDLPSWELSFSRALAAEKGMESVAGRMDALIGAARESEGAFRLTDSELSALTGSFEREGHPAIHFVVDDAALQMRMDGAKTVRLKAVAAGKFVAPSRSDVYVHFTGRSGLLERVVLYANGERVELSLATTDSATAVAGADGSGPSHPAADDQRYASPQAGQWPAFRGAGGAGIGDGQRAPVSWDVATGRGIRWKVPIAGIANSSPIIWDEQVFVSSAVSRAGDTTFRIGLSGDVKPVNDLSVHEFKVFSIHKRSGRVLWEHTVEITPPHTGRHGKASQANSTPATDGESLVVLFGSIGKLYCFELDGTLRWKRDIGTLDSGWFYDPDYQWGHSSSPIVYGDRVIVQADIQEGSFLAAYSLKDGDLVWKTERDEVPTWATPALFSTPAEDQIVTNGTTIRGYDPSDGRQLWSLGPNSEIVVAAPVVGDGRVFLTAGYPPIRPIYAVLPGARGDISLAQGVTSNDRVAWSKSRDGTYIPTPIYYRGYLYTCANNGRLRVYDGRTGEEIYRTRIGKGSHAYAASPVAADGKIYFSSEDGTIFVVKAGSRYELLASNSMDAIVMATPAISDGVMVVRTLTHVVGLERSVDSP